MGLGQVRGNDLDGLESPFNVQIIDPVSVKDICVSDTGLRSPQETTWVDRRSAPLGKCLEFKESTGQMFL